MSVGNLGGLVSLLSGYMGCTDAALKLIISLFLGYPIALAHRKYFYGKDANLQHLYLIFTGFALGYWNYGYEWFHCVFSIFFSFCTMVILKGTIQSVAITFVFNMAYLLFGYYYSGTDEYDINWTMPQCILTLRLIGVAFDLYDGHQPVETLSADSKKLALIKRPSILEYFGFSLFPSAFLVGPQFPMKRYQDFISGKFGKNGEPPNCMDAGIRKLAIGIFYLVAYHALAIFVTDDYMMSPEYGQVGLFKKMVLLGIYGRYGLYKYIACWLLTEGSCIMFGIAHNGEDENGEPKWDGLENIKLGIFENTTQFTQYIVCFNCNTNFWVGQYVYKRLKFLNNRLLSQFASLMFLAVWHGFHNGYYVTFFFEFIVVYMERDLKTIIKNNEQLSNFFATESLQLPFEIMLRLYTFVFMGWCILPFNLLKFEKYWVAWKNVYMIGMIAFCLWPIVYAPILRAVFKKTKVEVKKGE